MSSRENVTFRGINLLAPEGSTLQGAQYFDHYPRAVHKQVLNYNHVNTPDEIILFDEYQ